MIVEAIKEVFADYNETIGSPRVCEALRSKKQLIVNHKKVERLMREYEIRAKIKKVNDKYDSYDGSPVECDNLINRDFQAQKPLQKIFGDITEFKLEDGSKVYLNAFIDGFNNEILTWSIGLSPTALFVTKDLKKFLKKNKVDESCIIHTDNGSQYRSEIYKSLLKDFNIKQSASRVGKSIDNALIESFFGKVKTEMFRNHLWETKTLDSFTKSLNQYIHWYNNHRIVTRLKTSPVNYKNIFYKNLKLV